LLLSRAGPRALPRVVCRIADNAIVSDLRPALNQNQLIGDPRFHSEIEAVTGQRRVLKKRERPAKVRDTECRIAGAQGGFLF
jgi:putative transposase